MSPVSREDSAAVSEQPEVIGVAAEQGGRAAAITRGRAVTSLLSRNAAVVALVVVIVLGVVTVPTFGSVDNFRNVALAASFIAIIAAGMTFVIISGGIDLSVGSTYALAVIVSAMLSEHGSVAAFLGALLAASAVGLLQGLIVAWL